jgi:predicted component of type VI protein secretion system
MEFERENDLMDQRQEMVDDAIDDAMGMEDETEGDEVVEQVLEEVGIDLRQAVSLLAILLERRAMLIISRWGKRHRVYRPMLLQRAGSRKLLEAAVLIQVMMTSKLGSIASEDDTALVSSKSGTRVLRRCFVRALVLHV